MKISKIVLCVLLVLLSACGGSNPTKEFVEAYHQASYNDLYVWVVDLDKMEAYSKKNGRSSPEQYVISNKNSIADFYRNMEAEEIANEPLVKATDELVDNLSLKLSENLSFNQLHVRVEISDQYILEIYTNGNARIVDLADNKNKSEYVVEDYELVEDYVNDVKEYMASIRA